MTYTLNIGSHDKANGGYVLQLNGMQLLNAQQKLLAALLRRPSLMPTVLQSSLRRTDFPEELRNAFDIVTKEPSSVKQIVADPGGDLTIRRLYMQIVELAEQQALRIAEQIVFNVRHKALKDIGDELLAKQENEKDGIDLNPRTKGNGYAHGTDGSAGNENGDKFEKETDNAQSKTDLRVRISTLILPG